MLRINFVVLLAGFALACFTPEAAQAKTRILACEPEWAALAEEVGGDKIRAFAATHAKQDPHHIRARPSLIAKARRADIILCSGADLEVGWLPLLLQRAKADVQPGAVGNIMAADFVPMLEIPAVLDRSLGDIHAQGNPHLHLDPRNILRVAEELTRRLVAIDPDNAAYYKTRGRDFVKRWRAALAKWERQAAGLRGRNIVVHHRSFSYFLNWLGIKQVGSLEPRPGIPPSTAHLEKLLQQLKGKELIAIIRTPYEAKQASEWLAGRINSRAIILPYTIGGDNKTNNLFSLFENTIALLQNAK